MKDQKNAGTRRWIPWRVYWVFVLLVRALATQQAGSTAGVVLEEVAVVLGIAGVLWYSIMLLIHLTRDGERRSVVWSLIEPALLVLYMVIPYLLERLR